MNMIRKHLWFMLLMCLFLNGCTESSRQEDQAFLELIGKKVIDVNQSIKLELATGLPNSKLLGDDIYMVVTNNTGKKIQYSLNEDLKVFVQIQEEKWMQVRNNVHYSKDYIISNPEGPDAVWSKSLDLTFAPEINNANKTVTVKLVVIGQIMEGDIVTDQLVASYYDLVLSR